MPTELAGADPETLRTVFSGIGGGRWEQVIYFRNPQRDFKDREHPQAGWIDIGDAQPLKLAARAELGCMPLKQFGTVTDGKNKWGPILSHPDGPSQFPVEQILAYKWYDGHNLRHDWPTAPAWAVRPDGLTSTRLFPQLKGVVIEELPCPSCHGQVFLQPNDLFTHMHVHHNLEPVAILELGDRMGINFTRRLKEKAIRTIAYDDELEQAIEAMAEEEDDGFTVTIREATGRTAGRPRDAQGHLLSREQALVATAEAANS